MLKAVRLFSCLPHRFESVGGHRAVQWIDDSKATNVGAAISALETVGSHCLWIGGGSDKASDFKPLAEVLKRCARRVILYGEAAEKIETAIDSIKDTTPIVKVKTLDEAVSDAATNSVDGDTVLLSPACASFDQYENYRQRGEHFAQLVRALP